MSTSGTYGFNPALGGLGVYTLGKCNIRQTAILAEHLSNVQTAANLVLADLANLQPNLWTVDLQTVALMQGQSTVTCPTNTVLVTDAYITQTYGGVSNDRILLPIGRSEYAAYPIKLQQNPPNVYWVDRIVPPVITLYPVPDGNGPYTLNYYRVKTDQDAVISGGTTLDLPVRVLKAFADALAAELALIYAPERWQALNAVATISMQRAQAQDREVVPIYISVGAESYFR